MTPRRPAAGAAGLLAFTLVGTPIAGSFFAYILLSGRVVDVD